MLTSIPHSTERSSGTKHTGLLNQKPVLVTSDGREQQTFLVFLELFYIVKLTLFCTASGQSFPVLEFLTIRS